MSRSLKRTSGIGLGNLAFLAMTTTAMAAEQGYDAVEAKLRSLAPNATTIVLSETPIEGVLQAQINNEIVYISADGEYLIEGTIIEVDTRTNITNQARATIRKGLLEDLDSSQQITFSPEKPSHELLVFTDIDCGYCRKLHAQIADYMAEGIAIHYLAFPRAGIGSHSFDKFVSVWCAEDQQDALTMAKLGTDPEPLQCDNPVTEQYELGRVIGVTGTPALVTVDGTLIPGYMPPAQLKKRLVAIEAQLAQAP